MLFSCIKGPVDDPANNPLKPLSLTTKSAGIYTQTTDVEGEVNGLMTYDRKVMVLT
ncbi:MAG: hypothetical protein IJT74_04660 [Bacteroidales bacterium]|nr:hypothetical protein [Bacteroidales bacterium]